VSAANGHERSEADRRSQNARQDAPRSIPIAPGTLTAGAPVVVLLSGGRDSVCLLGVAVEACGAEAVTALHVDYGLRDGSTDDAAFCAALCERLGVVLVVDRPRRADGATGNLQAWARDVRYTRGTELALARGADVATGHTATDQAETILYRLASSPSRRALLGMAPRSGRIVRPLLGVTRTETAGWCRAHGFAWRDDPTNETDHFARGRVRGALVPALRDVHPAAEANVVAAAALLREEAAVLDELVEEALGGRDEIAVARLAALPRALARLVVVRLAERAVGRLVPRAGARTDEILALAARGGRAALDLGDGARVVIADGVCRVVDTPPPSAAAR
jgi:tRNA(Ile)-lysidine synthase